MIQVTLLAYFVLAALAALMLAFPDRRVWLTTAVGEVWAAFCTPFSRLRQLILNVLPRLAVQFGARMHTVIRTRVILHRRLVVLAFAVVFAPSLMVLVARGPVVFDFADYVGVRNRQIGLLLEGEHLVPPLPLPPEVFVTREVELVRPDIGRASRDWGMLDEEFTQRLLAVFRLMKERHGYEMVLLEGYRSPQRQAELLSRGRHVTQAGANMSYHQYGLAADAAFLRDGRIALSERDPWVMRGYDLFGELAEQAGLTWGGKWTLRDFGHVELRRPGVLGRDTRSNAAAG